MMTENDALRARLDHLTRHRCCVKEPPACGQRVNVHRDMTPVRQAEFDSVDDRYYMDNGFAGNLRRDAMKGSTWTPIIAGREPDLYEQEYAQPTTFPIGVQWDAGVEARLRGAGFDNSAIEDIRNTFVQPAEPVMVEWDAAKVASAVVNEWFEHPGDPTVKALVTAIARALGVPEEE